MKILAIESSCDETSCAIVERADDRFIIKSNIIASQIETHRLYGGVVPEIASRAHIEAISSITYEALEKAGITMDEVDAVAVTSNPGLIGALLVGVNFAKALALAYGKPLVNVDHIKGHIASCYLDPDGNVPKPPFIALAASGGHTAIYYVKDYIHTELIGTTRDDAIGESFDKIGRLIGIPYPAGAGFDALATEGFIEATGDEKSFYKSYKRSEAYRNPEMTLPSPAVKAYISRSVTEFWRRWHISLSTWFKEYVYIPLGGNRKGMARQIINIAIVWALTGFWHGANWNFLLWGVYYAILLVFEKTVWLKLLNKLPKFVLA